MDYDYEASLFCNYLINYNNINNLSFNKIVKLYINKYNNIDDNLLLVKTVSLLSKKGYDILSINPFKLSKFL